MLRALQRPVLKRSRTASWQHRSGIHILRLQFIGLAQVSAVRGGSDRQGTRAGGLCRTPRLPKLPRCTGRTSVCRCRAAQRARRGPATTTSLAVAPLHVGTRVSWPSPLAWYRPLCGTATSCSLEIAHSGPPRTVGESLHTTPTHLRSPQGSPSSPALLATDGWATHLQTVARSWTVPRPCGIATGRRHALTSSRLAMRAPSLQLPRSADTAGFRRIWTNPARWPQRFV